MKWVETVSSFPRYGPPQQSLSITVADMGLLWVCKGGWGCRAPGGKSELPCWPGVGNYAFISMSFCLLGICTTHVVSVCFYLFIVWNPMSERERKATRLSSVCSLTWEELCWLQSAEIIFIHSDVIFHCHSIRSLDPVAINNSTDIFIKYSTATCTAFWILEENGIINKPISYTFLQSYQFVATKGAHRGDEWWDGN